MDKTEKNKTKKRHLIQLICTVLANGYLIGYAKGNLYHGGTKAFCVPVLNCYSCPGALGACPIGAMQAVMGDRNYRFSFYVLGSLMLFGIAAGRLICGFMCPFGFLQDLLYKAKTPKLSIRKEIDSKLRYLKYIILFAFVIVMPMVLINAYGYGSPYFCKLVCPAGTLGAGIPLLIADSSLRSTVGILFSWKLLVLIVVLIASVLIYRPFCKYLCPLGAFYGFFNKYSLFQMTLDEHKCVGCMECERACKMGVQVRKNCNSAECIRCGDCEAACRHDAIKHSKLRR